jgi:hypothetical protein
VLLLVEGSVLLKTALVQAQHGFISSCLCVPLSPSLQQHLASLVSSHLLRLPSEQPEQIRATVSLLDQLMARSLPLCSRDRPYAYLSRNPLPAACLRAFYRRLRVERMLGGALLQL